MLADEEVARIVQAFAGAALDPAQWLPALSLMSETAGINACALEFADLNTGQASMECNYALDTDVLDLYEERVFHINPRVRRAHLAPVGRLVDDRYLLPADDPHSGEFLDWLSKTPNRFIQGAKILDDGGHQIYFGSHYSAQQGFPDADHHKLHHHVIPHLVNFIAMGRNLSVGKLKNQLVPMNALEADRPFGLLDKAGRLVECSHAFEAVLKGSSILGLYNRLLVARQAQHRHAIERFLRSSVGEQRLVEPPLPIRLTTPDAPRGLVLRSLPLAPEGNVFDIFRPSALITITDLDKPYRVRREKLTALFGLTGREAEVAASLGEGHSVEGAALRLSISEHTVRQHLKAVFGKMGVDRQSDLVAIIARIAV